MRITLFIFAIAIAVSCTKTEPAKTPENPEVENPETHLREDSIKAKQLADSLSQKMDTVVTVKPQPVIPKADNKVPVPTPVPVKPIDDNRVKAEKPVIYLYPETEKDIIVRFRSEGEVIATYPDYKNGWTVRATPEGKLNDLRDGQPHNYLFYECEIPQSYKLESGFLVSADSVIPFLQKSLKQIGLLPSEYNDMISYWLPRLKQNPWNVIHFTLNSEYDKLSTLEVIPIPDSQLRVMMEFVGLDAPVSLPVQPLPHFERKGFTVVEWGGTEFSKENLSGFYP